MFLVPKSDLCSYAVLDLPEDEDPMPLCTAAVDAVDGSTGHPADHRHQPPPPESLNLQKAAQEADDAQKFLLYTSQPSVMRCEDLPKLSEDTAAMLLEKLRMVESALENRSGDAALKNLEDLFRLMRSKQIPFSSAYQIALLLAELLREPAAQPRPAPRPAL